MADLPHAQGQVSPVGDHEQFAYHYFQREAVETLIYLYEVAKVRRHKNLVETFATRSNLRLLQYDDFGRYCVKMATGSGKTKVISLAIAWQFFNAVAEARDDYAKTFLLIAPNVIVFERLRTDFEGGRIFRTDPIVPPEMEIFWRDFQCYMRGEGERASSLGALYLTNVQQFYERQNGGQDEPEEMTAVLGPKPPARACEMRKASGTKSFAACMRRHPADWRRNWISRPRPATARDNSFPGRSTTIRSSRRSSIMS
jgi:type III restriction enzyme